MSFLGYLCGYLSGSKIFGHAVTLSVGMIMIFAAWLQFINFSGNWPIDQPYVRNYIPSESELKRLEYIVQRTNIMSKEDWDDYRRCKLHNICLRKFDKTANLIQPYDNNLSPFKQCVTINGVPNCSTLTK